MLAYFKPCMAANKISIVQMPIFVKDWSLQIENLRTISFNTGKFKSSNILYLSSSRCHIIPRVAASLWVTSCITGKHVFLLSIFVLRDFFLHIWKLSNFISNFSSVYISIWFDDTIWNFFFYTKELNKMNLHLHSFQSP